MDNSAVHTGDILVVDDTLANLRLLVASDGAGL